MDALRELLAMGITVFHQPLPTNPKQQAADLLKS